MYYSNGQAYDIPKGKKPKHLPKQTKAEFEKQRDEHVAKIIALTGEYKDKSLNPVDDNTPPQKFIDAEVAKYNDAKSADRAKANALLVKANALLVKAGLTEEEAEELISFLKT